jgi:hypothetical protein
MMVLVMTGSMAATIDRANVLAAAPLEEYMVYICAMLSEHTYVSIT